AEARDAYWSKAITGADAREEAAVFRKELWRKDLYFLTVHVMNQLAPNRGHVYQLRGMGDIADFVSGPPIDGGIQPYAKKEFDEWATSVCQVVGSQDFAEALKAAFDKYEKYQIRRDVAEYLFSCRYSPLLSSDWEDYLIGWYVADKECDTIAEA